MGRIRAAALEKSGQARVVGVFDIQPISQCQYRIYTDERQAVNDPDVEAIFICTPNNRIVPLCKAALGAGKHVFSEKPPAFNAHELEAVKKAERASGKVLMYGFNHRHHESIQHIKKIIESGELGKILWMRGRYGKEVDQDFFKGWRSSKELAGGGILLDQGIHMLDIFLYLGGGFDEVQALVSNLFWKIDGIEDNVFAQFRSSTTGICASLHSTMTQWRYLFSLEIFLEGGALILNGLKTSSGAYGDEELTIKYNDIDPKAGHFDREIKQIYRIDRSWDSEISMFLNAVLHGRPVMLGTSDDALKLMKIIDRIYSFKTQTEA
jgi:predicted dehydrogenase